jgi:hypothetical protein
MIMSEVYIENRKVMVEVINHPVQEIFDAHDPYHPYHAYFRFIYSRQKAA